MGGLPADSVVEVGVARVEDGQEAVVVVAGAGVASARAETQALWIMSPVRAESR